MRKMAPPETTVSMIAFGMMLMCFASFVYIVTASKPMKEKQTTVAPVSSADSCTPSWTKGSELKTRPDPSPLVRLTMARTQKSATIVTAKMSRTALKFAVPRIDEVTMPVMMIVYSTTQTQAGASGTSDSMYRRAIRQLTIGSSR